MKKNLVLIWVLLITAKIACIAEAQPVRSAGAEEGFQIALRAFESENYEYAFFLFKSVYDQVPEHTRTTAAYLMAGKSLHRHGDHGAVIELLEKFMTQYPTSSYRDEASSLIARAQRDLQDIRTNRNTIQLGLALPLSPDEFATTRSIFRGILLAVDAYNLQNDRKIRLVFRDTEKSPEGARSAVTSLLDEDVAAIIGPLFSEQVDAATLVTEPKQVVMIAPMATSSTLTDGRNYVFQMNATLDDRGRFIARQALEFMSLTDIGVVTEAGNETSEEMTQGFIAELEEYGLSPSFVHEVTSSIDWSRLPHVIGRDTLSAAEAIYFSVDRSNTSGFIENAIRSIVQERLRPYTYVLGPTRWKPLNLGTLGSRVTVFYVDNYYENSKRMNALRFIQAYKKANKDVEPNRFAYIGYDIAGMLLENLGKEDFLVDHLLDAPLYEGVGMRIQFGTDRRNTAHYLFEHMPDGPQPVR